MEASAKGVLLLSLVAACGGSLPPQPAAPPAFKLTPKAAAPAPSAVAARPAGEPVAEAPPSGPAISVKLIPRVLAGRCAIAKGGTLRCPGTEGLLEVPTGRFATLERERELYCGVRVDSSAVCWFWRGGDKVVQLPLPPGGFASIVVGNVRSEQQADFCGIRPQGDVDCWSTVADAKSGVALGPIRHRAGKFVRVTIDSSQFEFLDENGRTSGMAMPYYAGKLEPPAGPFRDIGRGYRIAADGTVLVRIIHDDSKTRGDFVAHEQACNLVRDGSIQCVGAKRTTMYPGPFVMMSDGCAVRLDGRLKEVGGHCLKDTVVEVPEALRARIAVGPESLALKRFNDLEKPRAQSGTPKEYRVSFNSKDDHYLVVYSGGAHTRPMEGTMLNGSGTRLLDSSSDFVLVDINGDKLQFGDPIYIKLGKQYVAVGADAEHRVGLASTPSALARWTIHAYDPDAALDDAYESFSRGLGNVLIRSSTGEFLIPCEQEVCGNPPPHAGVRPAGGQAAEPPWWVTDPRFSDVDVDDGWFLQSGWEVFPLVTCEQTDLKTKKKRKAACPVVFDE